MASFTEDAFAFADIAITGEDLTATFRINTGTTPNRGIVGATYSAGTAGGGYGLLIWETGLIGINTWNGDLYGAAFAFTDAWREIKVLFKDGDLTGCRIWIDDVELTGLSQVFGTPASPTVRGRFAVGCNPYTGLAPWLYTGDMCYAKAEQHSLTSEYYFAAGNEDKVLEESGGTPLQISNASPTFWSTDDDVCPINFTRGFFFYENGADKLYSPYELTAPEIPAGYSLSAEIPPLVFGPWEGWFKVPYDAILAPKDVNNKLYTGTTPNEIYFSDLQAGGFGEFIWYDNMGDYYKRFIIKK